MLFNKYVLSVLLFLLSNTFGQESRSLNNIMTMGLAVNPLVMELGGLLSQSDEGVLFSAIGGYGGFGGNQATDGYESMTSVMGTVNVFDDQFEGEFSTGYNYSFGVYLLSLLGSSEKCLIHQIGITHQKKEFFNKYYDSLQILGNNGKYYLRSNKPNANNTGMEIGTNLCIPISDYPGTSLSAYLGFSYSTFHAIRIRMGFVL